MKEETPHNLILDVRDRELFGFKRIGYVRILADDIKAAKKTTERRLPLSEGGEIVVSFELRSQKVNWE